MEKSIIIESDSLDSISINYPNQFHFTEEGRICNIDRALPSTTEHLNCSICMESFVPTELISWSPRVLGCYHAFHKNCIREWLLRHRECPCCRQIMLPVDVENSPSFRRLHLSHSTLRLWTTERNRRYHGTTYCASKGVIDIDIDIDTISHFDISSSMSQYFTNHHCESYPTTDKFESHGMKTMNPIFDFTHTFVEPPIPKSETDVENHPSVPTLSSNHSNLE
jgi:hypothetical protein